MSDTQPPYDGDDTIEIDIIEIDVIEPGSIRAGVGPAPSVETDTANTYTEGDDNDPEVVPGTTNEDIANS